MRSLAVWCLVVLALRAAEVPVRPAEWAVPVPSEELANWYKLNDEIHRCEQFDDDGARELQRAGIKSVLNLRRFHRDDDEAAGRDLVLHRLRWETDEVTIDQVVEALRIIRVAAKPLVIHCWHGSDRTGIVCAAYRIVFQDWTPAAALDEMVNGGYGYHAMFANLPELILAADWPAVKARVMAE